MKIVDEQEVVQQESSDLGKPEERRLEELQAGDSDDSLL